jgi:protein-disulfide isomerase
MLVGLLGLYFALGYAVAKVGSREDPRRVGGSATAAGPVSHGPTHGPVAVPPAPALVEAPIAAPAAAPAVAPAPPAAPTVAAAPPPPAPMSNPPPAPAPAAPAAPPQPPADPNQIWKVTVSADDAQVGPVDAPLTVVLFSSFGCGTCLPFKDAPKRLVEKYGDKIRVVFKHKVIPATNPDDVAASIASLAAKKQGKFWEFHDATFNSQAISTAGLEATAQAIGLDLAKYKVDIADPALRGQVFMDSLLANGVAAHSMPNLMVNGVRMAGDKSYDNLVRLIDQELPKAEAALAGGADRKTFYDTRVATGKEFPQLDAAPPIAVIDTDTPILGKKEAPITLTVFEDFECPFCAQIASNLKAFHYNNPEQVRVLYKFTPLRDIHPNAQLAAEAAAEANVQGKFWEYYDVLYQNYKTLDRASLERFAEQVGLDMAKFKAALDGGTHKNTIEAHLREAANASVSGTPTVFINGKKYQGPRGYPPEGFEAVARTYFGMK